MGIWFLMTWGYLLQGAEGAAPQKPVRFMTYNVSFYRDRAGQLQEDLATGRHPQARAVAEVIQKLRPDVLLLNEFDYQPGSAALFQKNYLGVSQGGRQPITYSHWFVAPVNTGVPIQVDVNKDGKIEPPQDTYGFGRYVGQYGMLVLSRYPIDEAAVRTFQMLPLETVPGVPRPVDLNGNPYYTAEAYAALRMSSKSHWDVPIVIGDKRIHFLVSHPTPPVFDGPEDRNGLRNWAELRFWADYISPGKGRYIVDDKGQRGGLPEDSLFVIGGDLNRDPVDGGGRTEGIAELLKHPRVQAQPVPASKGGPVAAQRMGGLNAEHQGNPAQDTVQLNPRRVGNLRLDYLLPSNNLDVVACGVFWPLPEDPEANLIEVSDHRPVWVDLQLDRP